MSEQEIIEGNKLIAKFIYDDSFIDDGDGDCYCESPNGMIDFYIEDAKYDSSWDWLMPVVEKIADIPTLHPDGIFKYLCCVELNPRTGSLIEDMYRRNFGAKDGVVIACFGSTFIESVWLACVEFVKWYNQSKTN